GGVTVTSLLTLFMPDRLGNRSTLFVAVVLNLIVGAIARQIHAAPAGAVPQSRSEAGDAQPRPAHVFAAAFIVGFAFLLMELVWYRMLGPLLGGTTFTFGLILAVALLGIGAGGIAFGVLFSRKHSASVQFFAMTCASEAFFIALPYALGDRIAMVA